MYTCIHFRLVIYSEHTRFPSSECISWWYSTAAKTRENLSRLLRSLSIVESPVEDYWILLGWVRLQQFHLQHLHDSLYMYNMYMYMFRDMYMHMHSYIYRDNHFNIHFADSIACICCFPIAPYLARQFAFNWRTVRGLVFPVHLRELNSPFEVNPGTMKFT